MTSLIGVGMVVPEPVLVVLDLVPELEEQVVVPELEGQVVEQGLVPGLKVVVVQDLVVYVVLHFALIVFERLAVVGWVS